jgi:hypothetical protein
MDAKERERLIKRYRDGFDAVEAALRAITEDELDRSAEDGWTPRQVVHHLADSEMEAATRLRRLLALSDPMILAYDEKAFAGLAGDRPIGPSLEAMRWARESTAQLLHQMKDGDWQRAGTHTERGRYTTETWLQIYASHAHDHAAQIRRARGKD